MVFGGPYSNLEATRAVLDEAVRLSISADRIICTGDVVAYGADAAATVDLVRDRVCHVVMGNCEQSLAAGSVDCGCGFPTGSSCERLSAAWFAQASRELNNDARAWMADLPRQIDIEIGGCRLAVIHGGADIINRFIFASTATAIKLGEIRKTGVDGKQARPECTAWLESHAALVDLAPSFGHAATAIPCRSDALVLRNIASAIALCVWLF
jgi:predicted phosphodiesterase